MSSYMERAVADVQRELSSVGLSNLTYWVTVEISYDPFIHNAFGWYHPDEHTIRVPGLALPWANNWTRLKRYFGYTGDSIHSLRDVLRHEYGHALRDALGQFDRRSTIWGKHPCISAYASSQESAADRADEDFAETFMLFLKRRGKLRHTEKHPAIGMKWAAMARAVESGGRRRLVVEVECIYPECAVMLEGSTGSIWTCPDCGTEMGLS